MNLVTRTTEYPNGVKVTENFESDVPAPVLYEQDSDPKGDTNSYPDEPYTFEFYYDGFHRVVQNPQLIRGSFNPEKGGYNALLGGIELTRDDVETCEYKNYSLSKILPVPSK